MVVPILMIVGVLILVVTEGFFSGSETVFTSAGRPFLNELAERGDRHAQQVRKLLERTERFLGTTLMGTNLAVVSSTTLCQILVRRYVLAHPAVQDAMAAFPVPWSWENLVNTLIMAPLILVFGEMVPKSLGRAYADPLSLRLIGPVRAAGFVLSPFVSLVAGIARRIGALLGTPEATGFAPKITRDDLRAIAELAAEQGLVPEAAGSMLRVVFELDERKVSSMMIPLVDVHSLPLEATVADAERLSVETGYARFPVYSGRIDEIVGIVDCRELLYASAEDDDIREESPIRDFLHTGILFVPESKPVSGLLHELRYRKVPMAVVVDEHGGVTGILTTEDLIEEVVGDIEDERDRPGVRVRRVDETVFECEGKLEIRELEAHLGVEVDHDGFETAAGLVLKIAGRIPAEGDRFRFDGYEIVVLRVDRRRIARIRFRRLSEAEKAAAAPPLPA